MIAKYRMEPNTTASSLSAKLRNSRPKMTSLMMMAARPMTIAPRPMLTSALPWYCAYSPPASPTSAFESTSPSTLFVLVLMPCARAMLGLAPVARMECPTSVPKNQYSTAMSTTQKIAPIRMASGI